MANITLSQAKKLCTANELALVEASRKDAIQDLATKELKAKIGRARKLRDKWRDQATTQRRAAQQAKAGRGVSASERSEQKQELFSQVLERFEKRLAKVDGAPPTAKKSSARKVTSNQRVEAHRSTRAATRQELADKVEEKNLAAAKKKKKKKAASAKSPAAPKKKAKAATASATMAGPSEATVKRAAKKVKAAVKKQLGLKSAGSRTDNKPPARDDERVQLNQSDQIAIEAQAKKARIQESGLTTRTRGHVSARARRDQAKRDQE